MGLWNQKAQEKDVLLTIFLIQTSKPKKIHIKVSKNTTCWEILATLNKKYDNRFIPSYDFSLIFVHKHHGEKVVDEFDSPLLVAENYETKML